MSEPRESEWRPGRVLGNTSFDPHLAGPQGGSWLRWAAEHPDEVRPMGVNARRRYEEQFRAPVHLAALVETYRTVTERGRRS